jgi:hypothetical protein
MLNKITKIIIIAIIAMVFTAPLIASTGNPIQDDTMIMNIYLEDNNGIIHFIGSMTVNSFEDYVTIDLSNYVNDMSDYTTLILENTNTGEFFEYPDPGKYIPIEIEVIWPGRTPASR